MTATANDPSLTLVEANEVIAAKTAPKITLADIKAKVAHAEYFCHGLLTICILTLRNEYKIVGKSAPASPDNFDPAVGERLAYEDALRQIWPLEGYLLREQLSRESV
jgi:hypothetical protein